MAAKSHHRPGADAPSNYLYLSIFTILCCFSPLGIIALIFSLKVNSASNYDEAQSASKASHCLNVAGITIGIILLVVGIASLIVYVYYAVILPNQSLSTTTTFG